MPYYKKKSFAKKPRYAKKVAKKPSYKKTVKSSVFKQIAEIKRMCYSEKKRLDATVNSYPVAQLNVNASGTFSQDITPQPANGTGYSQKTGSAITVATMILQLKFWQQTNNTHKTRGCIEIFKIKGTSWNVNTFVADYFLVSTASGVVDYDSQVNPDFGGTCSRITRKEFINAPAFSSEIVITDILIPLRLNHNVRFDQNSTTIDDGQLIMVIRCDSGNFGTLSTQNNCPVLTASSGLIMNYDIKSYFYDH